MRTRALLLVPCLWLLGGCGASTVRVEIAPTLDSGGRPGVESSLSIGVGMPLDFHGRSHHYLQALGSLGGGLDGRTAAGMFMATGGLDYIYWSEPKLDVRAGVRFADREIKNTERGTRLSGIGTHIGFLPMLVPGDSGWLLSHLCLGPELRLEYLWGDPTGADRALLSLPLILELNLLAAGD